MAQARVRNWGSRKLVGELLENSDFRLLTTCILSFLHKAKHIYAMVNTMVASTAFHHS